MLRMLRSARPGSRRVRTALVVAPLTAALVAGGLLALPASPAQAASPDWQSGVYVGGCDTTQLSYFKKWRKAKIEHGLIFLGMTWREIENPTSQAECFRRLRIPLTVSVPIVPYGASIETGARGSYNSHFRALARNLVRIGQGRADIRPGWEFNGDWFPWSARRNPTAWKKYWVQIVTSMRSVPGAHFTFTWAPGNGTDFNPARAYPGDRYVTYIGQDVYDAYWKHPNQHAAIWKALRNGPYGLVWQAKFAAAHHKKMAYPEWGLATPSSFSGSGGGDNALFIRNFYRWVRNHNVAYEVYFNRDHSPNVHRINNGTSDASSFRNAARVYRAKFGGTSSGGTVTKPRTDPKPTAKHVRARNTLLVSAERDRDRALRLGGKRIASKRAVFIRPSRAAVGINYFLDGRRIRYERDAPFDFAGTARSGNAKMFRFGKLSRGRHILVAVIDWEGGGRKVVTAKFRR